MNDFKIVQIHDLPNGFNNLVEQSLSEDLRFLKKLKTDWDNNNNRFDKPGELLFAAFSGSELIGVCGRNQDPYTSDNTVGRVRHLYVSPQYRKLGVGKALVQAVMNNAMEYFRYLRLRTFDKESAKFYQRIGFTISDKEYETHRIEL